MHDDAPELTFVEGFVPDADTLFATLRDGLPWDARMRARKTASFGRPYNYAQMTYGEAPIPAALVAVIDRLEAGLGWRYDNCLANLYDDGERTMGFHVDDLDGMCADAGVAVVSLGAPRSLVFQRIGDKSRRVAVRCTSGSLLWMPPSVQHAWKHGVPAEPGAGARISLTFRRVAPA